MSNQANGAILDGMSQVLNPGGDRNLAVSGSNHVMRAKQSPANVAAQHPEQSAQDQNQANAEAVAASYDEFYGGEPAPLSDVVKALYKDDEEDDV